MKVGKALLAVVLIIVAVLLVFNVISGAIAMVMGVIKSILGLAFAVAIIGGLGWAILRLLGHKSLGGGNSHTLP